MTSLTTTDYVSETISLKRQIEGYFIQLAERLHNIKENRLWEGNYATYSEFLQEIDISESTSTKLILIYRTFVLNDGLKPEEIAGVSWTTLYEITRVEGKDARKEFVENANVLKRNDIIGAVNEFKTGCVNHDFEEISMKRCKTCGKLERNYGLEGSTML